MRYNLYYLFKEDQSKHPLDPTVNELLLNRIKQLLAKPPSQIPKIIQENKDKKEKKL